jgi:hypothetical protein
MGLFLHSKKRIPNYVLMSIALAQSEIYWFYSVLYCLCQASGLLNKPPSSTSATIKRSRSYSAPQALKKYNKECDQEEADDNQERRFSLPNENVNIRDRPTEKDEQADATCPPTWWQKTRVKLGQPPVRGNTKPKKSNHSNSSSPTVVTFAETSRTSSIQCADNDNQTISEKTYTVSPLPSPTLFPADKKLPILSPLCLSSLSSNTSSSTEDSSSASQDQPKKSKSKFLTKINAALHHRRKNDTNEPRN